MSERLDQLFDGDSNRSRRARLPLVWGILAVALPLNLLGVLSCTAVPGAVVTLMAWWLLDQELALHGSGMIDPSDGPALLKLKQVTRWFLAFCGANLLLQIALLSTGVYEGWLLELSQWVGTL